MHFRSNIVVSALALLAALPAHATLLGAADHAQLTSWLGQGPLALQLLFAKAPGHTAADFHAAADGRGRTFTVMQAYGDDGRAWLVGGYNPQSWSSSGGFNLTPEQADRTAFLFNLTSGVRFQQLPVLAGDDYGAMQTVNEATMGPTFGAGFDLSVPFDLTSGGVSALLSYNNGAHPQNPFTSLLDKTPYQNRANVRFGDIEVYTVNLVPEPGAGWLAGVGLAALALACRRRKRRDSAAG
ncbi:MAG: PEP_CTERM-anchored TLD domain-containing protein [Burkholderiaceae bacterium]|nr:PEP_CTERM-anchored TLD domain-containing protein [Burkholderiaceae bacterium]